MRHYKVAWGTLLGLMLSVAMVKGQGNTAPVTIALADSVAPLVLKADSVIAPPNSVASKPAPAPLQAMTPPTPAPPKTQREEAFRPNPKKALLFSIIPGGGQIYNRKYWKIPIIMGMYTACYYAITWNNTNLKDYTEAYRDIKSTRPMENKAWMDFIPINAKPEDYVNNSSFHNQLKRGRDFFRRNRDLSIIVSVGVYLLVMVDAYVDAELFNFDISPNVALNYTPTVISPIGTDSSPGYGVRLALSF